MKRKNRFFAQHAKSSAIVLSLTIHVLIILAAFAIVAVNVLIPKDPEFIGVAHQQRPAMPRLIPKPEHLSRRTSYRPDLKPVKIKTVNPKIPPLLIPTIASIQAPFAMGKQQDLGGLICTLGNELKFFGGMSQKGEKVVFLVHAGPATTSGREHEQSPHSRMTFYTLRKRLNQLVDDLPEYTLFNVAFYWAGHTTPMAPNMLPATQVNKRMMTDWGSTLNPLESTETYGSGFDSDFNQRLKNLAWPEKLESDVPEFGPRWYYNYRCSEQISEFYNGQRGGYENWARALCFAMEQKPDTIFILCTGYVIGNDDPAMMSRGYKKMALEIYGPDRKRYPTVNVVVLNKVGNNIDKAFINSTKFEPITSTFRGKSGIIKNIKDVMTPEEIEQLAALKN
jgi:hypothetical protein